MKLQVFDSSYFCGKGYFENDGTLNYLVFAPVYRYLNRNDNNNNFSAWISKWLSDESIKPPAAYNDSLAPVTNYIDSKIQLKFDGSCLK